MVKTTPSLGQMLTQRARSGSGFARIALASEAAVRVYPVYEEYWVGTYTKAVQRSQELGWQYACGEAADENERRNLMAEALDLVEFYGEEGIDVLQSTVSVALYLLESLVDDEEKLDQAVGRALMAARAVAQSAEAMANHAVPRAQRSILALPEEEAWQDAALNLIAGWQGLAKHDMFDPIGAKPPAWLVDWRVRSVR